MPRRRQRRQKNRTRTNSQSSVEIQVTENETIITATSTPTVTSISGSALSLSSHVPQLYIPSPDFLNILKDVGARGQPTPQGETFLFNQLASLLIKYIKSRHLYDDKEPSVVYCDKDPLGKVFGVNSFTNQDALDLLRRHCFPVEHLCYTNRLFNHQYRKEQFAAQQTQPTSHTTQEPEIQVDQVVSSTGNNDPPFLSVVDTPPLTPLDADLNTVNISSEVNEFKNESFRKNSSSGHDTDDGAILTPSVFTVVGSSSPRRNDSGLGTDMGDPSFSRDPGGGGTPDNGGTPPLSLSLSAGDGPGGSGVVVDPCEGSSSKMEVPSTPSPVPRPGKGVKRKRHWTDSGLLETRVSSDQEEAHNMGRKRGSSFSLVLDEGTSLQWGWLIPIIPSSDDSEILSVQSKETAYVKDSSDNDWSSEEEMNAISIEISPSGGNIDPPFPEEYDVDSDSPDGQNRSSADDSDSTEILEEIYVVCPESDMEWWADSESSDSDSDISVIFDIPEEDKWKCQSCENMNTPLHRFCDRCMETRPDWLPPPRNKPVHDASITSSGEDECDGPPRRSRGVSSSLVKSVSEPTPVGSQPLTEKSNRVKRSVSDSVGQELLPESESNNPMCKICFSKPKDASIIHGKTGHQVCCYGCAKKLRRRGKPCPVCRRTIQRVVKNFLL